MPRLSLSGGQTLALGSNSVQAVYLGSGLQHFNPRVIPGLAAWYDASVASSITLNGGNAAQWDDLSGNDRHQIQANASLQPIYSATGLNGRGTLSTTGTQWMQASAFASSEAATIFLVWKIDDNSGIPFIWQRGVVNEVHSMLSDGGTANNSMAARRGSGNTGTVSTPNLGTGGTFRIATLVFTTTLSRIFNGNTEGIDNTATVAAPTGNKVLTLFALDSANRRGNPGLAEFIYYDNVVGATQQSAVRNYLSKKWSIGL